MKRSILFLFLTVLHYTNLESQELMIGNTGCIIKIGSVNSQAYPSERIFRAKDGYQYIGIFIQVDNKNGRSRIQLHPYHFKLKDNNNMNFECNFFDLFDGPSLKMMSLDPGELSQGWICFEIPFRWTDKFDLWLYYDNKINGNKSNMEIVPTLENLRRNASSRTAKENMKMAPAKKLEGDELLKQSKYSEALEKYNFVMEWGDNELKKETKQSLSELHIKLGDQFFHKQDYGNAKDHFMLAKNFGGNVDNNKISQCNESFRRSSFLTGLLSLFPGGGMLYNRKDEEALTHFAVGIGLSGTALYCKILSNQKYNDYKKSIEVNSLKQLYTDANNYQKYAGYLAVAYGAFTIVSMYLSISETSEYNNNFAFSNIILKPSYFSDGINTNLCFSLCIQF
jgi:hypothetical protein